jgi:ubiquinol-cytochrome c reductase cytochrome b subunit
VTPLFAWLLRTLDDRLGLRKPGRKVANKVFPDHWSFLLGEVTLFAFVILVLTGVFLTMFYRASMDPVVYDGTASLYAGRELPEAYASILRLSYDVPGGLLFRRIHLGAAYVFVAAAVAHLLRVLLTGAFRRPREVNYHVGVVLLVLAIATAYTGQNLRFDLLSGTSLRIAYAFLETVPLIGQNLVYAIFGGEFPGEVVPRFFVLHVLLLPGMLIALISLHLAIVARQRHTQFARPGIDDQRFVAGKPLWPHQFATSASLMLVVGGMITAFAVLIPWADVLLHGPFRAASVSNASWPDFWLFWVQGALTLVPAFEWDLPGVTVHNVFVSGVILPLAIIGALAAFPFVDRRLTRFDEHIHLAQRPLEVPARAALVAAGVTFVVLLSIGAANPVLARILRVPVETVIVTLRVGVLAGPVAVGLLVYLFGRRANRVGEPGAHASEPDSAPQGRP